MARKKKENMALEEHWNDMDRELRRRKRHNRCLMAYDLLTRGPFDD